ncbi:ribosomal protein L7/L12 [Clostridium sp.]|uniref:ribosomal protein L7/L12 n=2 Tax=unclassified Clostridium TaxID=2614128 RepID=UPI00290E7A59|nr:ribosomal protein L7/L12 [Clostridium sp.]MDU5105210.1 ribosomal protein L7/L12 [Clostridium sp.]
MEVNIMDGLGSVFLFIIVGFMIIYISQIGEEVKKLNKTLDKLVNHFGIELYRNIDEELKDIILNEGKIKAIKKYREHTGLGLKEAKEYIDNLNIK